jgi:hypothetical protein
MNFPGKKPLKPSDTGSNPLAKSPYYQPLIKHSSEGTVINILPPARSFDFIWLRIIWLLLGIKSMGNLNFLPSLMV